MSETLYEYPLKPVSWNERDVLLFANSIGCEPSELQYLYVSLEEIARSSVANASRQELHPKFSAFPTYPIVLTFKHDYQTITSFKRHFTRHLTPPKGFVPGFPELDIDKVVDGERTLEIYK